MSLRKREGAKCPQPKRWTHKTDSIPLSLSASLSPLTPTAISLFLSLLCQSVSLTIRGAVAGNVIHHTGREEARSGAPFDEGVEVKTLAEHRFALSNEYQLNVKHHEIIFLFRLLLVFEICINNLPRKGIKKNPNRALKNKIWLPVWLLYICTFLNYNKPVIHILLIHLIYLLNISTSNWQNDASWCWEAVEKVILGNVGK